MILGSLKQLGGSSIKYIKIILENGLMKENVLYEYSKLFDTKIRDSMIIDKDNFIALVVIYN